MRRHTLESAESAEGNLESSQVKRRVFELVSSSTSSGSNPAILLGFKGEKGTCPSLFRPASALLAPPFAFSLHFSPFVRLAHCCAAKSPRLKPLSSHTAPLHLLFCRSCLDPLAYFFFCFHSTLPHTHTDFSPFTILHPLAADAAHPASSPSRQKTNSTQLLFPLHLPHPHPPSSSSSPSAGT